MGSNAAFAVHCCEFYRPPTSAINCLALDEKSKRIALSRADGCIEIWTMQEMPPCRERIFPYVDNASVEALSWCRGRLFATGLDGFLREWSLNALWPVNRIKVTPSAAWCMASNYQQTHLAIGTESGAVHLVTVSNKEVGMDKCVARSGGRIISVAWSQDGRTIVTGSIGDLRVWDVLSGRCLSRMTTSKSQVSSRTLIWSIAITSDPVIITGDSRGVTSFWDYQTSTLINEYQSHKADVLAVCWCQDRNWVFSSGIDPTICKYHAIREPITNKNQVLGDGSAWVASIDDRTEYVENVRLNLHTHDVRCLLAADEWLVSGGVDGVLTFSKYPPKTVIKCFPFNPDTISVAPSGHAILLQYPEYLELWRLGATEAELSMDDGEFLPLSKRPEKLAQIKCRSECRILCSAVDDTGRVVAYSDGRRTVLCHVKLENEEEDLSVVVQPIQCLNVSSIPASTALRFASSSTLLLTTEGGNVQKLEIDDVICRLQPVLQIKSGALIRKLACSKAKSLAAVVTVDNEITIIDYEGGLELATSPRPGSLIVDIKLDRSGLRVLALCADGRLLGAHIDQINETNSNPFFSTSACRGGFGSGPLGFTIPSADDKAIIVYGDDKVELLSELESDLVYGPRSSTDRFEHVCSVDSLEDGSLVIVRMQHEQYLTDLPPSLNVKKYGTG